MSFPRQLNLHITAHYNQPLAGVNGVSAAGGYRYNLFWHF